MSKYVEILNFIFFLIYFVLVYYREVKRNSLENDVYSPFHLVRIDSLFFLIVYASYVMILRKEVLLYPYLVIMITNIVYIAYDLGDNYKLERLSKKEIATLVACLLVLIVLFIISFKLNKMIAFNIFSFVIILIIPIVMSGFKFWKKNWFLTHLMIFLKRE